MSWLSNLFGGNKKRDTTYSGTKPVTTLGAVQGGPEYYNAILGRTQGKGVGFGNEYASQYANPIVKNMRNQFTSYQLPELTSELSATGRRRSSGGFDQIRRAYQEQGLAEGDIFSRLQQRNEDQQRSEINAALADLGQYAQNESSLVNNRANFDATMHGRELEQAAKQRAEGNAATGRLLGTAGLALSGFSGGLGMGGGMGSGFQSYYPQYNMDYYSRINPGTYGGMYDQYSRYGQQGGFSNMLKRILQ